jgi:hypothetical protein
MGITRVTKGLQSPEENQRLFQRLDHQLSEDPELSSYDESASAHLGARDDP